MNDYEYWFIYLVTMKRNAETLHKRNITQIIQLILSILLKGANISGVNCKPILHEREKNKTNPSTHSCLKDASKRFSQLIAYPIWADVYFLMISIKKKYIYIFFTQRKVINC